MTEQEGPQEDSAEGGQEEPGDQGQPPEAVNLVPQYLKTDAEWLNKEASKQCRLVKKDFDGAEEWRKRRDNQLRLYAGIVDPMKYPAEGAKSVADPLLTRTILQLWSRGWDQICPAKGDLIQVSPVGMEDDEQARRRHKHMNWQLRNKIPNWVTGHGESYLQFLLSGSVFRAKWFDPVTQSTQFDHLTADEVIVSYTRKDVDPLMRRVPRVTRVRYMHRWELEQLGDAGYYFGVEKLFPKPGEDGISGPAYGEEEPTRLMETNERIDGIDRPAVISAQEGEDDLNGRTLHECHRWMVLPDQDRMKPVIFTVDLRTKQPLSLTPREDEDPRDRMRFDAEMEEWQAAANNLTAQYQSQLQAHAQQLSDFNMNETMGMLEPGTEPPQEPPQPQLPPTPQAVRMRVIHNIVHYRCFPNPHGFYGIGVGFLLENSNELLNELSNEYLLASKFANMQTGLLPKGASAKRGPIQLQHGKFTETELEADQMTGIRHFQFPGPSESLWKMVQATKKDGYTLISDVDTLSGEAGPTNETKAAAQQRNANATALISVIVRLYIEPLKEEVKLLAHDNAVFLDDKEFFWVTEPVEPGQASPPPKREEGRREDYFDEFNFFFTADQRIQPQTERVQIAMNVIDRLMNSPYVHDGAVGPQVFYVAFQNLFRALDKPDMQKAMGPPPPPPQPPQPPQPMAQEDENQMFFKDQAHPALPDDDHVTHLRSIQEFRASPYFAKLSSTGKQILDRHEREHVGFLYRQQAQQKQEMGYGVGLMGDQQGSGEGMAGGPGNGAPGAPPLPGAVPPAGPPGGGLPQ